MMLSLGGPAGENRPGSGELPRHPVPTCPENTPPTDTCVTPARLWFTSHPMNAITKHGTNVIMQGNI